MKKIIHVNRQHIAMNLKDGKKRPVYTIKAGSRTLYATGVEILGPCKLVQDNRGLKCGAKAWIETESEIVLENEMSFKEARNYEAAQ